MESKEKRVQSRNTWLFCQVSTHLNTYLLTYLITYLLTYLLTHSKRAFQVFEEREKSAREYLEQSPSMNNTMYLHSFNVKNALVSTKSRPKDRPDT